MYDLKAKRERFPWFWLVILIGSVFLGVQMVGSIIDTIHKRDVVNDRKHEREVVAKEQEMLKEQLKHIQSPEYIEEQARERLGLGKVGETVVLIETPENTGQKQATSEAVLKTPLQQWWDLLR